MRKLDPAVKQETLYIACWVIIFSVLMQAVYLIIGAWEWRVLLANVIISAATVLNFLLLGITVQNAVAKDEQDARNTIRASQIYRKLGLMLVLVITYVALQIGTNIPLVIALAMPIAFPRIAIAFRPLFDKHDKEGKV